MWLLTLLPDWSDPSSNPKFRGELSLRETYTVSRVNRALTIHHATSGGRASLINRVDGNVVEVSAVDRLNFNFAPRLEALVRSELQTWYEDLWILPSRPSGCIQ